MVISLKISEKQKKYCNITIIQYGKSLIVKLVLIGMIINLLSFGLPLVIITAFSMVAVFSRAIIYNVLALMGCFFGLAGFAFILKDDFIAFLLLIIYVGAIVVLFLFMVMMMDREEGSRFKLRKTERIAAIVMPLGILISGALLLSLDITPQLGIDLAASSSNIIDIGIELYKNHLLHLQLMGTLLFVGVVGTVALTLEYNISHRRKVLFEQQTNRRRSEGVKLIKVETNSGIDY